MQVVGEVGERIPVGLGWEGRAVRCQSLCGGQRAALAVRAGNKETRRETSSLVSSTVSHQLTLWPTGTKSRSMASGGTCGGAGAERGVERARSERGVGNAIHKAPHPRPAPVGCGLAADGAAAAPARRRVGQLARAVRGPATGAPSAAPLQPACAPRSGRAPRATACRWCGWRPRRRRCLSRRTRQRAGGRPSAAGAAFSWLALCFLSQPASCARRRCRRCAGAGRAAAAGAAEECRGWGCRRQ